MFSFWCGRLLQLEVERYIGEASFDSAGTRGLRIIVEIDVADQTFTGGVGEVVPQVFVTGQIDLRSQVTMTRRRNEEVNVRRALTMTSELIQHFLHRWRYRPTRHCSRIG